MDSRFNLRKAELERASYIKPPRKNMWRFFTARWECEVAFNGDDVYFGGIERIDGSIAPITTVAFKSIMKQAKEIIDENKV